MQKDKGFLFFAMSSLPFANCARRHLSNAVRSSSKDLGSWASGLKIPVVYSERYNFSFWGLEKLHPFDSCKFRTVLNKLVSEGWFDAGSCVEPVEAAEDVLLDVHSKGYLRKTARNKCFVVQVCWDE